MQPYATAEQLTAWLPPGVTPDDVPRLLKRATAVVQEAVVAGYYTDLAGRPTDPDVAAALADACCAQVEQWLEVGEENDVAGYPRGTAISGGGLSVSSLPSTLAPRAARALDRVGLRSGWAW